MIKCLRRTVLLSCGYICGDLRRCHFPKSLIFKVRGNANGCRHYETATNNWQRYHDHISSTQNGVLGPFISRKSLILKSRHNAKLEFPDGLKTGEIYREKLRESRFSKFIALHFPPPDPFHSISRESPEEILGFMLLEAEKCLDA